MAALEDVKMVLQSTMIVTVALWVKFMVSNLRLGDAKMKAGKRAAEDFYQEENPTEEALAYCDRAQRVINNDLENIPFTMIVAWGSFLCIAFATSGTGQLAPAHTICYTAFLAARITHTFTYEKAWTGLRSLSWLFGVLTTIALMVIGVVAAFS